jgi:hypothetical protein
MRTRTAEIALRADSIVSVDILDGAVQTLSDARENVSAAQMVSVGVRRPLLVDIRRGQALEAEARHYYSGRILEESFTAIAMVIEASPLGKMMGNVYLRLVKATVPIKLFTHEADAAAWLENYRL